MKDLVDIVLLAQTQEVAWPELRAAVVAECSRRGMEVPSRFAAPDFWGAGFERFARRQGLDAPFEGAYALASGLFDPVLGGDARGSWLPGELCWTAG